MPAILSGAKKNGHSEQKNLLVVNKNFNVVTDRIRGTALIAPLRGEKKWIVSRRDVRTVAGIAAQGTLWVPSLPTQTQLYQLGNATRNKFWHGPKSEETLYKGHYGRGQAGRRSGRPGRRVSLRPLTPISKPDWQSIRAREGQKVPSNFPVLEKHKRRVWETREGILQSLVITRR